MLTILISGAASASAPGWRSSWPASVITSS
jgi:hypothetical protein